MKKKTRLFFSEKKNQKTFVSEARRFLRSAFVLFLLLGGCAQEMPGQCKLAHLTDLPLALDRSGLTTPATLNDQPTVMVVDSGSQMTLISRSAADRLHLSLSETGRYVNGIGGAQTLYYFYAKTFQIGQLHGRHLALEASDIGAPNGGRQIDGLFGADFLSNYDIDFDLPDHKIRLFKVLAGCSTPSANLTEPMYIAHMFQPLNELDRRPHVVVTIDGVRLHAVIDSGAHNTAIFRNAARRLGLRLAALTADKHYKATGIGPEAREEVRHIMSPMTIGEITISNMPVGIIDESSLGDDDMLLGRDFLRRVHVWLAFSSHTLIMQYPPAPSPKLQDE